MVFIIQNIGFAKTAKLRIFNQASCEKSFSRISLGGQPYIVKEIKAQDRAMASVLSNISNIIIPVIIFYIIAYGVMSKTNVYEDFVKGAKDGLKTVVGIMPTLVALMTAVGVLRASGFLSFLEGLVSPLSNKIGFPAELVPLAFIKMFSSSAATGLVLDIFKNYGTDSLVGLITSIMMSCTETIFYTMSVYFLAAKVTKTKYTLTGALLSTIAGIAASVVLAGMMK